MKKALLFVCVGSFLGLSGCAADVDSGAEEALRQRCGGIAGTACPDGYTCVDDARDSCDPNNGGADCGGICRRSRRTRCDSDPSQNYISRDPEQCALIHFICAEGQEPFFNDCGCGCQDSCNATGLCIEGYVWDDTTCSCEPAPGEACGPVNCAAGEVCCNASCGICTPPGYFCTQQACVSDEI